MTNAQIAALDAAKLTGAIVSTQIADDAITTAKLAAGAVTAAEIAALTITAAQIAASTITGAKIAANTIAAGNIVAGTITATEIAAATITAAKIAADTITAAQIAAGAITASELAAGAVIAGKIAAGTIVAADIAAATITGDRIAANTITAGQIAADTITAGQIAAGAIGASELAANSVVAGKIAAGTIVAADIAAATITGSKIAAGTILAANIATYNLTAANATINDLQVGSINIANEAVLPSKFFNRDFTNLVRDPDCRDLSMWVPGPNTTLALLDGTTNMVSSKWIEGTTNGATSTVTISSLVDIPIAPYEMYNVSAYLGASSGFTATSVTLSVKVYSLNNGVLTLSYSQDIQTRTNPSGILRYAGPILVLSGRNRMSITATIVGASGVMKGIMTSPVIKKCLSQHAEIYSAPVYGPFNQAKQTIQTLSFNHGLSCTSVTVWASFKNTVNAIKNFDVVELMCNGVQFATQPNQNLDYRGVGFVFGSFSPPEINPGNFVSHIDLNVQLAVNSNSVANIRINAISNSE